MDNYNEFPTPTKVDTPLDKDENGYEARIYWLNSYSSVIGIMFYLE